MKRDLGMFKEKYTKSTSPDGEMASSQAWEATSVKGRRHDYGRRKKYGYPKAFKKLDHKEAGQFLITKVVGKRAFRMQLPEGYGGLDFEKSQSSKNV